MICNLRCGDKRKENLRTECWRFAQNSLFSFESQKDLEAFAATLESSKTLKHSPTARVSFTLASTRVSITTQQKHGKWFEFL